MIEITNDKLTTFEDGVTKAEMSYVILNKTVDSDWVLVRVKFDNGNVVLIRTGTTNSR